MKKTIYQIMDKFSKQNRTFQNEQQFQFELAMEIEKNCDKSEHVILEYVSMTEKAANKNGLKRYFSDIVIKDETGKYIVIELKFKTKQTKTPYYRENYGEISFVNQGATDLTRFDYLLDIRRIELLKNHQGQYTYNPELKRFDKGYAILLTNDEKYWITTKNSLDSKNKQSVSYYDMCIGQGDHIARNTPIKYKGSGTGKPFVSRNSKNLTLDSDYTFLWNDYGNYLNDKEKEFKYLIAEI